MAAAVSIRESVASVSRDRESRSEFVEGAKKALTHLAGAVRLRRIFLTRWPTGASALVTIARNSACLVATFSGRSPSHQDRRRGSRNDDGRRGYGYQFSRSRGRLV